MLFNLILQQRRPDMPAAERTAFLMHELEQQIAFALYALRGETAIALEGWPDADRRQLHNETKALIARFDPAQLWAAELRAREALALDWKGVDYSGLTTSVQNAINHLVKIVLGASQLALEGHTSPLAPSRAAELSPERRTM